MAEVKKSKDFPKGIGGELKDQIYAYLSSSMPQESIQRTRKEQTKKGYDTTGIGYQYEVNRFNEVLGLEMWGFDWEIIKEIEGTFRSGATNWEIATKVGIWVLEPNNVRTCCGSHLSSSYGDALKGAITNAFKKTAAFWGVGRQAYEGSLDDDLQPRKEGEATRTVKKTATSNPLTSRLARAESAKVYLGEKPYAKILAKYDCKDAKELTIEVLDVFLKDCEKAYYAIKNGGK